MSATSQKWLLRAAPWFLPVGIVALWRLAVEPYSALS